MLPSASRERVLVEQLLQVLQGLPGTQARLAQYESQPSASDSRRFDAVIDVRVNARALRLLVEARKSIFPRDAQQLLWQFRHLAGQFGASDATLVPVLAAQTLSPGAKSLLLAEQVGYFDSGGSLFLSAPGAYVYVDRPPAKAESAAARSLFSGRRSQAIHALLLHHGQWMGVNALAAMSQVSPATASEVMSEVEKRDWLATRGQGPSKERQLRDPRALLDAWAAKEAAEKHPALRRYFVPDAKADALLARVAAAFDAKAASYAISHEAAAQRYAPYLSTVAQVRSRVVLEPAVDAALADIDAREVGEGFNFAVIPVRSSGELLFRERAGDAWLASPIHVYLDLLRSEGRSREMADHLRKERIGF